jgi:hypothetical protein
MHDESALDAETPLPRRIGSTKPLLIRQYATRNAIETRINHFGRNTLIINYLLGLSPVPTAQHHHH